MPFPQPNGQSFYLTSSRDISPLVHAILEPSSRTWQYVVVDPTTLHGVIIDPVASRDDSSGRSSFDSTDDIIGLIEKHEYRIDHILETESSPQPKLTAAWSLRMHFSNTQGYPPEFCSNSSVSALHRSFARKYGAVNGFSTTLSDQHDDKSSFVVGRMKITVLKVPGFRTPNRRAYLINGCIFGAYSIAIPPLESTSTHLLGADTVLSTAKDDEERRVLWKSMIRVLSLPAETCVYPEEAESGAEKTHWISIENCRGLNRYVALNENEFIIRRRGEQREHENTIAADVHLAKSRHKHGKRSR